MFDAKLLSVLRERGLWIKTWQPPVFSSIPQRDDHWSVTIMTSTGDWVTFYTRRMWIKAISSKGRPSFFLIKVGLMMREPLSMPSCRDLGVWGTEGKNSARGLVCWCEGVRRRSHWAMQGRGVGGAKYTSDPRESRPTVPMPTAYGNIRTYPTLHTPSEGLA